MRAFLRRPILLQALLLGVLYLLLTLPIWQWLWGEWMHNEYYGHGLLVPFVSLFLCAQRIRNDSTVHLKELQGSLLGLLLLAVGMGSFLWFLSDKAWYLAAFAMILLLAGLVWTVAGTHLLTKLRFPIGYLLLMAPLPFIERLTLPLALFTGVCSGGLAKFLGANVTIVGNAVSLPNADLVIGAQCSGVNSLITLSALMALVAYLLNGPWWGRVLLVLSAIPLAMAGNILRVASLFFVAQSYGVEAAFRFYHDYSGILFFIVALLLIYPLAQLFQCKQLRMDVI